MSQKAPVCSTCLGTSFYTDEQGYLNCDYCGMQSQEFFAESNEADDGGLEARVGGRLFSRRFEKEKVDTIKDVKTIDVDVFEALNLYQFCLQMLMKRVFDIIQIENHEKTEYFMTLKQLWNSFLTSWSSVETGCKILDAFVKQPVTCMCDEGEFNHPPYPSKPLLIGFIYLVLRMHRTWITPGDIVRWCVNGQLPYTKLYEILQQEALNNDIPFSKDTHQNNLYNVQHQGKSKFISTNNILFHMSLLAQSIHITVPPLNTPLIAYTIMNNLHLPEIVWEKFNALTQMQSVGSPMTGCEVTNQQYVEHIFAIIVVAIRLCDNWENWVVKDSHIMHTNKSEGESLTVRSSSNNIRNISQQNSHYSSSSSGSAGYSIQSPFKSHPRTVHSQSTSTQSQAHSCIDLSTITPNSITRSMLSTVLSQIRTTVPKYTGTNIYPHNTHYYQLNSVVRSVFKDSVILNNTSTTSLQSVANVEASSTRCKFNWAKPPMYDSNITMSDAVLCGESIYDAQYKSKLKRKSHKKSVVTTDTVITTTATTDANNTVNTSNKSNISGNIDIGAQYSIFSSHVRYSYDVSSLLNIHYVTLVERVAQYAYIPPSLLHLLVERIDKQIINYAYTGTLKTVSNKQNTTELGSTGVSGRSRRSSSTATVNTKKRTRADLKIDKRRKELRLKLPQLKREGQKVEEQRRGKLEQQQLDADQCGDDDNNNDNDNDNDIALHSNSLEGNYYQHQQNIKSPVVGQQQEYDINNSSDGSDNDGVDVNDVNAVIDVEQQEVFGEGQNDSNSDDDDDDNDDNDDNDSNDNGEMITTEDVDFQQLKYFYEQSHIGAVRGGGFNNDSDSDDEDD